MYSQQHVNKIIPFYQQNLSVCKLCNQIYNNRSNVPSYTYLLSNLLPSGAVGNSSILIVSICSSILSIICICLHAIRNK